MSEDGKLKNKMSVKIIITGTLSQIDKEQKVKETRFQQIHISVKRLNDNTQKVEEETYPVTIFNDKIEKLNALSLKGKVVSCTAFLNPRPAETKEGKKFNALSLSGSELKIK